MEDLPAQEVIKGYLNRRGNRMTPNTSEGVTMGGKRSPADQARDTDHGTSFRRCESISSSIRGRKGSRGRRQEAMAC